MSSHQRTSTCPKCSWDVHRAHRGWYERIISLVIPLKRYECTNHDAHVPGAIGSSLKTVDVIVKVKSATSLKVEHKNANCAICHRRAVDIVGIYAPRGESIPLCAEHLEEVKPAIQERLAELEKK